MLDFFKKIFPKLFKKFDKNNIEYNEKFVNKMKTLNSGNSEEDRKKRYDQIIQLSQQYIGQIKALCDLAAKTRYKEIFESILKKTCEIHDYVIMNDEVPFERLDEYHAYYTVKFLSTYNLAFKSLKTQKIYHKLSSAYALKSETVDNVTKEYSVSSEITINDIKRLKDYIKKHMNEDLYIDESLDEDFNGTTLREKYVKYLQENMNMFVQFQYVGETKNTLKPIVYYKDKFHIIDNFSFKQIDI